MLDKGQQDLHELVLMKITEGYLIGMECIQNFEIGVNVVSDFTKKVPDCGGCMSYTGILDKDSSERVVVKNNDDFIDFLKAVRKASCLEPVIKISQDYDNALIDALDYIESFRLCSHLYYNSSSKYLEKAIRALKDISEDYFESVSTDVQSLGDIVIAATIPSQLGGYKGHDVVIAPRFMLLEFGEDGFVR